MMSLQSTHPSRTGPRPLRPAASLSLFMLALTGVGIPVHAQSPSPPSPSSPSSSSCFPLKGSSLCSTFNDYSISRSDSVIRRYPFLDFVSDTQSFDRLLEQYIKTDFTKQKYRDDFGCSALNLTDTDDLYARYTISIVCNALVQLSKPECGSTKQDVRALCADTCAQYALSEHQIVSSPDLCGVSGSRALDLIRADFVTCSLPPESLDSNCITGPKNEGMNCGFQASLVGLCSYCAASSPNSTDTCCINARAESRCVGVHLPTTTQLDPVFPTATVTAAPESPDRKHKGLSNGAIAGIVVGSVLAALAFLLLALLCLRRRRQYSKQASRQSLNRPSPSRGGTGIMTSPGRSFVPSSSRGAPSEAIPAARVTGFAALQDENGDESDSIRLPTATASAHGNRASRRQSTSHNTPASGNFIHQLAPAFIDDKEIVPSSPISSSSTTTTPRSRIINNSGEFIHPGGLTLAGGAFQSVSRSLGTGGLSSDQSSPEGAASGQSEQLQVFYDYYSQEEIVPGSLVSTLWAYQPRANDEFELERGMMLRIVGIWDDGWATGVRVSQRAEDWDAVHRENRDSGVSNGNRASQKTERESTPPAGSISSPDTTPGSVTDGEIKAFPLVCVCLPQHWRKTIDGGDSSAAAEMMASGSYSTPPGNTSHSSPAVTQPDKAFPARHQHPTSPFQVEPSSPPAAYSEKSPDIAYRRH